MTIVDDWSDWREPPRIPWHSHVWINPKDTPISRTPYSPVIGERRREMKHGTIYVCRECGLECRP